MQPLTYSQEETIYVTIPTRVAERRRVYFTYIDGDTVYLSERQANLMLRQGARLVRL